MKSVEIISQGKCVTVTPEMMNEIRGGNWSKYCQHRIHHDHETAIKMIGVDVTVVLNCGNANCPHHGSPTSNACMKEYGHCSDYKSNDSAQPPGA